MADFEWGREGLSSEQIHALQKAAAYRTLSESEGYRRLLDFLEGWSDSALQSMRAASYRDDDRTRTNMQLIWSERENTLEEIQREVQRGIAAGSALAKEIDADALIQVGTPMEFSENE